MTDQAQLIAGLPDLLGEALLSQTLKLGEVTCEIAATRILEVGKKLRDDKRMRFESLLDLCGVDYADWGGVGETHPSPPASPPPDQHPLHPHGSRFAVVYHLLSLQHNLRLRLRVCLDEDNPAVHSVATIWPSADWYEREAFDLFGIIFHGHPDLRRLLTDYGFIGHPFRKDFPLSGEVEMRYDEARGRVVYQPVTIEPRTLVPRTIGKDSPVDNLPEGLPDNLPDAS